MKVNEVKKTIELTKKEMKAARNYGSNEYNNLQNAKRENPGFNVIEKKPASRETYKGLTEKYMKDYVEGRGSDVQKSEFNTLCGIDENGNKDTCRAVSYGELRMWFLSEFPEIVACEKILERVRKENAAKRAAAKAAA